jgi:recombination associated protein RdgC
MHFRNLTIYRLPVGWMISDTQLGEALRRQEFQPCSQLDMTRTGWVAPCAQADGKLHHYVTRQILIKLRTEKKLLPTSVIKAATLARAAELEEQQGFAPARKQMREIKERVTDELLPRAFSTMKETAVWIDREHGWLVIDTASPARADEVIKILLRSVDSLPVTSLRTALAPGHCMTTWLQIAEAPHNFTIDNDAQMNATSNKAAVRYAHHTLDHAELCRHIASGKKCTRLAMTWNDTLSFMLTSEMVIKRVSTHAPIDLSDDAVDDRFNADFILMCDNVNAMLDDLVAAFGGEDDQQGDLVQESQKEAA